MTAALVLDLFVRGHQREGLLIKESAADGVFVKDLSWVSISCAEGSFIYLK